MAITFDQLQSDVNNFAGLDIEDSERDRLLNIAHVELCTRAGWTKDTLSLGPTVANQTLYDLPTNFRQPADDVVVVNGLDYKPADPQTQRRLSRGELDLTDSGIWWIDYEDGARKLGVWPVPSAGSTIEMLAVVSPDQLADDDPILVPDDFAPILVRYVREATLGLSEDNEDAEQIEDAAFEREVQRLTALRIETENGDGPIQVLVKNVHW